MEALPISAARVGEKRKGASQHVGSAFEQTAGLLLSEAAAIGLPFSGSSLARLPARARSGGGWLARTGPATKGRRHTHTAVAVIENCNFDGQATRGMNGNGG